MKTKPTLGDILQAQGVSRRGFMKYCAATASLLALPLDGSGVIRGLFAGSGPAKLLANMEESSWSLMGLLLAWILFGKLIPYIMSFVFFALGM